MGLFPEAAGLPIGADLTAALGLEQYEPPIPTFLIDPKDGEFHTCGRNYSYRQTAEHPFWRVNERYGIRAGLESLGGSLALQGEILGPGIQCNGLGLKEVDYFVFTVVNTATRTRLPLDEAQAAAAALGVPFVPVLERGGSFAYSLSDLLEKAKGRYRDHFPTAKERQEREGIVVRSLCGSISFKAINNNFLLAEQ